MLVAEAIGLEMELTVLNTMAGEHLTPEYEEVWKINTLRGEILLFPYFR